MELIDHEAPDSRTKGFSFPSDDRKVIVGPDDLTRGQAKTLGRQMKVAKDVDNDDFFAMVFTFWALLPGTTWNLARKGKRLSLTESSLETELSKGDFASLAIEVTRHLYPFMFEESAMEAEGEDDVMDGLDAEEGSQAAEFSDEAPDPNA